MAWFGIAALCVGVVNVCTIYALGEEAGYDTKAACEIALVENAVDLPIVETMEAGGHGAMRCVPLPNLEDQTAEKLLDLLLAPPSGDPS